MARIASNYPAPIYGVSTLAPRNRATGQAAKQINFRSDPVAKLTRRPPLKWDTHLINNESGNIRWHSYTRDGHEYQILLTEGHAYIYKDGVRQADTTVLNSYISNPANIVMQTVGHVTYLVDTTRTIEKHTETDSSSIQRVSHINVTSALNYGETVSVKVRKSNGSESTVSYTIPELGTSDPDYDRADRARATKQVALELAARINGGGSHTIKVPNPNYDPAAANEYDYVLITSGSCAGKYEQEDNPNYDAAKANPYITSYSGISGVSAIAEGSTVAVWQDDGNWCELEVAAGQGAKSLTAINSVIEDIEGIPLFAVHGTRITIEPNPTTGKGTYYLQAERTANVTKSGRYLEEVVWTESRSPDEPYALKSSTMPHFIDLGSLPTLKAGTVAWEPREVGDDDSNPFPEFTGKTIRQIGYFQKRLVFASENTVHMSRTDDEKQFFRKSALKLLVTDRCAVSSSAVGADKLTSIVPHNRDLLVCASNGQFKISGDVAVTPETVSMTMTTAYIIQPDVEPVTLGNSVFMPISYGDSSGIQEYSGQQNTTQDEAAPITHHVIGLMRGEVTMLTGSSNLDMLAVVTDDGEGKTVFVYEQFTSEGKTKQKAWSEWTVPDNTTVLAIKFVGSKLFVVSREDGSNDITLKSFDMYSRVSTKTEPVHLDNLLTLETNGTSVTLPNRYAATDVIAVRGSGCKYELFKAQFTISGNTLTFSEDIGEGEVYIGRPYSSRYIPTRPFRRDENGVAITDDRIRVSRFILHVVDTHEVKMKILSEYWQGEDQEWNSRILGARNNRLGTIPFYTGEIPFSFAQDADLAEAEFYTEGYLGLTVAGISWVGQYHQSQGRM